MYFIEHLVILKILQLLSALCSLLWTVIDARQT